MIVVVCGRSFVNGFSLVFSCEREKEVNTQILKAREERES